MALGIVTPIQEPWTGRPRLTTSFFNIDGASTQIADDDPTNPGHNHNQGHYYIGRITTTGLQTLEFSVDVPEWLVTPNDADDGGFGRLLFIPTFSNGGPSTYLTYSWLSFNSYLAGGGAYTLQFIISTDGRGFPIPAYTGGIYHPHSGPFNASATVTGTGPWRVSAPDFYNDVYDIVWTQLDTPLNLADRIGVFPAGSAVQAQHLSIYNINVHEDVTTPRSSDFIGTAT